MSVIQGFFSKDRIAYGPCRPSVFRPGKERPGHRTRRRRAPAPPTGRWPGRFRRERRFVDLEAGEHRQRSPSPASHHALLYNLVITYSRCPSASAAVSRPLHVRSVHSINLSPASSMVISRRRMPETSTSICSLIVRAVIGLADSLMTGSIGLPMTLPWPVGNSVNDETRRRLQRHAFGRRRRSIHEVKTWPLGWHFRRLEDVDEFGDLADLL